VGSPPPVRGRPWSTSRGGALRGLTPACAGTAEGQWIVETVEWAHPRLCGDGDEPPKPTGWRRGSPPPVRGRRIFRYGGKGRGGLTPACAGTANGSEAIRCHNRAHPRLCGDGETLHRPVNYPGGSPPPVRGRRRQGLSWRGEVGLTPACAGTASRRPFRGGWGRAHPRLCGDGHVGDLGPNLHRGSPPPVRGRRRIRREPATRPGLTPACAGTAVAGCIARPGPWAHPRLCGDGLLTDETGNTPGGSPPPVRGRHRRARGPRRGQGLTPACAGTACRMSTTMPGRRAHPRLCGDGADLSHIAAVLVGSPPPVRGRHHRLVRVAPGGGLTPACAGTARHPSPTRSREWAHPRLCGDGQKTKGGHVHRWGSPPPVRGRLG